LHKSIISTTKLPNGQQELTLSGGEKLITDMYIPTFGLITNSSYIPSKFLDAKKLVMVDEYLAVRGAKNIWAIGDVSDAEFPQFLPMDRQSKYLAKELVSILRGTPVAPYKAMTTRRAALLNDELDFLLTFVGFCGLQIGKYTATGHYGNTRIPSFIVAYMRKNLFTHMLKGIADGTSF